MATNNQPQAHEAVRHELYHLDSFFDEEYANLS